MDRRTKILTQLGLLALLLGVCGCRRADQHAFELDQVQWRKQERMYLDPGEGLDPSYRTQVLDTLGELFGTPSEPRLPQASAGLPAIADPDRLQQAAGPVSSLQDGTPLGLYREHCAQCHGIQGDGRGPTSALLNPYPRDFRLGKFKYKSTSPRHPPSDADLRRVLVEGIPGTAMPAFGRLPEEEIDALLDYVKYLTIRGQYEQSLIGELPLLDGQPLVDLQPIRKLPLDQRAAALQDVLNQIVDYPLQERVLDRWATSAEAVTVVPDPPPSLAANAPGHLELIQQGQRLFAGAASCYQCHGPDGQGLPELINYDDWTNEWLNVPGVDPNRRSTYADFLAAGAPRPRPIHARNLHLGVYRGGGQPEQLYRRIANGIEGTPMPAATALTPEEIWALVAYVRSLAPGDDETSSTSADP